MPLSPEEKSICHSLGIGENAFTSYKLHKRMDAAARPVPPLIARMARDLSLNPHDFAVACADRSFDDTVSAHARKLLNAPDRTTKEIDRMSDLGQFDPDAEPGTHVANSQRALKAYAADPMGQGAIENLSQAAAFALLALEALLAPTGDYQQAISPAPEPAPPAAE